MIPREIFTSFAEFQGIVSVNDFRIPLGFQELLQASLGFLWSFGFARIRLDPLSGLVLHHDCMSVIVSRFAIVTEDLVISCYQVTNFFSTRYGFAIASSAWGPCNFGPFTFRNLRIYELPRSIVVSSGCPDRSSTELDTCTGVMSLLFPSFRFSNLNFTHCMWRRWGWRRWWGMTLLFQRCLWSRWQSRRWTWQTWYHNPNEVLRITYYPNPVLNEMWLLTIDPFVGIPVFLAHLSERQYCWRVFEDFHSQEFFPILRHTQLPLHSFALLHWRLWLS